MIGISADAFECHHTERLDASGLPGETRKTTRPRSIEPKSPAIVTKYAKVVLRANWQREQKGTVRPDAPYSNTIQMGAGETRRDFFGLSTPRRHSILESAQTETDQQVNRRKLMSKLE